MVSHPVSSSLPHRRPARRCGGAAVALAVMLGTLVAGPAPALAATELVVNGGFNSGTDPWWHTDHTQTSVVGGALRVEVAAGTTNPWDAIVGQSAIDLTGGAAYTLSFDASASAAVTVRATVQLEDPPYTAPLSLGVALDGTTRHFVFPFDSGLTTDRGQVTFQLGGTGAFTATLDNISLVEGDSSAEPGQPGDPLSMTDGFYVDPESNPREWVDSHGGDPRAAAIDAAIASVPMARWFGDWPGEDVSGFVGAADTANKLPILVIYNIPSRDCGSHSAGGEDSPAAYRDWVSGVASEIGDRPAIVVIEPDALAQLDCLPNDAERDIRIGLLRFAAERFGALANTWAYLDAANAGWIAAPDMAGRLDAAGIELVRGFALNVSNYYPTTDTVAKGEAINAALADHFGYTAPFLVDTSRNGNGHNGQWCNPEGRRLGATPQVGDQVGGGAELLVWVKVPGDSDGDCGIGTGTSAGQFVPELAMALIGDHPPGEPEEPEEPEEPGQPEQPGQCVADCTTIWPDQPVPEVPSAGDDRATELGVKFRTSEAGQVTGIRFYKGAGNDGTHVGSLWTGTGAKLAEVTFTGETATGWQEATFATPVRVTPGVTYVASYHAPQGHYSYDNDYFDAGGAGAGAVTALASGVDGPNGVYVYDAASAFPTETWADRNYWVGVRFRPDEPDPEPEPEPEPSTGFPNETNTGVPPGTVLQPAGDQVITTPGTVLDGLDIQGCVEIRADDVTIRRSRIACTTGIYPVRVFGARTGVLLEDVEITGRPHGESVAVAFENYTLRRANIHQVSDGPRVGRNTVVEDSYIHDLVLCDGCHNDGIQSTGGFNLRIRGNNIQHPYGQTSCVMLGEEDEPIHDVIVEDNLLNGGNYTIYAGVGPRGVDPNIIIRNNEFGPDAKFGLLSATEPEKVAWIGNTWHDTGEPIPNP